MKIVHHISIIHNNSSYKLIHNTTDITRWAKGYIYTKKLARAFSKADDCNMNLNCRKLGKLVYSFYYVSPLIFGSTFWVPYVSSFLWDIKMFFKRIYWLSIYESYAYVRKHYYSMIKSDDFQNLYWRARIKAIKLKLIRGRGG